MAATTFCIWRQYTDNCWQVGEIKFPSGHSDPDGSAGLLACYDGRAETYLGWARDYFDLDGTGANLTLDHVRHVCAQKPVTTKLVKAINPKLTLARLKGDIDEIAYPRKK